MAEETQKLESAAAAPAEEVTVEVEKPEVTEKKPQPSPPPPFPESEKQTTVVVKVEKAKVEESKTIKYVSFKEGTNVVAELSEDENKARDELKQLIQDPLNKHEFTAKKEEQPVAEKKEQKNDDKAGEAPQAEKC
ncbi:hypothetical protein F3Y22_tig00110328pilonHSYRG00531 [Hibiscus syriacus]|uniref:Uncharacterized protein n=1 Tax=Hibiscus syriacus TaxID=106335 RepID=A0A6A3AYQ6_HIBSY|nr:hypothetical protein F3Y22_tig00110328pilonHSYRG00531 [Hibiscus syriacus]